jgi:hypothetical protein
MTTAYHIRSRYHSGEVDVILLDNARIQRIEVHHEDILVPEPSLRLKDETTLVLVPFTLVDSSAIFTILIWFVLDYGDRLLSELLVGANILETMEFMQ